MPAVNKNSVESAFGQLRTNLRRVAASEPVDARMFRGITQEDGFITREKIDIPVEAHTEACPRLIELRRSMSEEHGEIDPRRKRAKKRRMILNRMGGNHSEAHTLRT